MTNPEEPRTEDGSSEAGHPDADRGASDLSRRRGFLAKLLAMSFLTAGVLRTGGGARADVGGQSDPNCASGPPGGPFSADEDCGTTGDPVDEDCGKNAGGGARHVDHDCAGPGPNTFDSDCGKSSGGEGVHSDEACSTTRTDRDCAGMTGDGGQRHSDSHCSYSSLDLDCGYSSDSGLTIAHSDLDCNPFQSGSVDDDCGRAAGGGVAQFDHGCSPTSIEDYDCGKPTGIAELPYSSDSNCSPTTTKDSDCGVTSGDSDGCAHPSDFDWPPQAEPPLT
jgi:hypothetical protein